MIEMIMDKIHVVVEVVSSDETRLYLHPELLTFDSAKELETVIRALNFESDGESYKYTTSQLVADVSTNYQELFGSCSDEDDDCDDEEEHDILVYNIIVVRSGR
jgi:peptide subunit release factor 1 (eRF1)